MSLGERFRAAREQRGLTLSDVAEHLRIRSVYLAAIEEENWSAIGAPVYTRGFLRTYARFVGLDPEEAVAAFNASSGAAAPQAATAPREPLIESSYRESGRSLAPLIWIAGIVAIALIGFVIYVSLAPARNGGTLAGGAAASPVPASAAPGANATAAPAAPAPSIAQILAIHLTAPSWLRVTVDGNVRAEGTFPAGTTKTFHGKTALVRVGNAGGVEITIDGKTVGPLGGSGDVVEKTFEL